MSPPHRSDLQKKDADLYFLPAGKACAGLAVAVGPLVCRCSIASCSSGTGSPGPPSPTARFSSDTGPADISGIQLPASADLERLLLSPSEIVSYLSGKKKLEEMISLYLV